MNKPLITLAAGLALASPLVMAAQTCTPQQYEMLEEDKQLFGPLSSPVCKALPNRPELTLASYFVWTDGGRVGERSYQWHTVMMDSDSNTVLARHRQEISEDAYTKVRPDSIWLDTANYALNDQVRAFGVRLNIGRKPECAKEYRGQFFNLFVYQNHILTPLLESLPMAYSRVHDGKDCGDKQRWDKEVGKSQLQMLPSKHYGFADIKVKTKGKMYYEPITRQRDKSRSHGYILKYDGERYRFDPSSLPGHRWRDFKDFY
ncbi:hypothetical protein [Ferrimonas sp. SCSIO 43195]|uniref:hypothetical protein n=1 Tax=Ferrimonas sp. SCSIO 43195 TaxID=2822844 RepID=UPI0020753A7D|nr:hypothetical protein [Ferrimonas sp. SCSIO 43195]USD35895.1 hypothetical protein J8Z22_12655 [Ferrimonas sp. SCSIO 43195]